VAHPANVFEKLRLEDQGAKVLNVGVRTCALLGFRGGGGGQHGPQFGRRRIAVRHKAGCVLFKAYFRHFDRDGARQQVAAKRSEDSRNDGGRYQYIEALFEINHG